MNNQVSKKHHFIPQFYIKGFSDDNNDVFIYDKEYNKIATSPKKPAQIFYEEHLHTIKKFGQTSSMIEDAYSELEGMLSKIVVRLKECSSEMLHELVELPEFVKILVLMMSVQYWRNPQNTCKAKQLASDLLSLYDQAIATNYEVMPFSRKDVKFFQKRSKDEAFFKVIQFFFLPLITFKFDPGQLKGLKIIKLYGEDEFLCSDNPVAIESIDSGFNFSGQVFYPITKKFAISNIDSQEMSAFDQVVLMHARKKVIASSRERLQLITQAQQSV
ncbi:DUF4238 domain-containing protein [Aeromonas hydrophila]|uniref:DUF4238 domain-containing protein n=1 Tax=Aeromonas hydrophila TaxID=644 RepID=UPI003985ED25